MPWPFSVLFEDQNVLDTSSGFATLIVVHILLSHKSAGEVFRKNQVARMKKKKWRGDSFPVVMRILMPF